MKFIVFASLIVSAFAVPAELAPRTSSSVCSGLLYSIAQCCATDVLGAVGLDCEPPKETPHDRPSFRKICASNGQQAKCCTIPIVGQGILCTDPV